MPTSSNILFGGLATVQIGDWVANAAAATLVDAGYTEGGVEVDVNHTLHEISPDQIRANIREPVSKTMATLKFKMIEALLNVAVVTAWRQPAGNVSGTGLNRTLRVGIGAEQYHQILIVGLGPGTTGVRTVSMWRASISKSDPLGFTKDKHVIVGVEANLMYDDTIVGGDVLAKFLKLVDA